MSTTATPTYTPLAAQGEFWEQNSRPLTADDLEVTDARAEHGEVWVVARQDFWQGRLVSP